MQSVTGLFSVPILNISVVLDIAESLTKILSVQEGSAWAGFEADG